MCKRLGLYTGGLRDNSDGTLGFANCSTGEDSSLQGGYAITIRESVKSHKTLNFTKKSGAMQGTYDQWRR
jgi:hypothetical protein